MGELRFRDPAPVTEFDSHSVSVAGGAKPLKVRESSRLRAEPGGKLEKDVSQFSPFSERVECGEER